MKKRLATIFLFLLLQLFSFAQKENTHSFVFEFSNPSIFYKYPNNHSQIFKVGYEWKTKRKNKSFGFGVIYGHPRFKLTHEEGSKSYESVISHGGTVRLFANNHLSDKLLVGIFLEGGTHVTTITFREKDSPSSFSLPNTGTNNFSVGFNIEQSWKRFFFRLKLPYEIYKDGETPFIAGPTIGSLFYDKEINHTHSSFLVKGFNPSIGIGYVFRKKVK